MSAYEKVNASNMKMILKTLLNISFVEGFLLKDNLDYFLSEVDETKTDKVSIDSLFANIIDIANDTLKLAFTPSYEQWLSVEPKMQSFLDNNLKSSALNTATIIAAKQL